VATLHDADDDTVSIGLQMMNHQQERRTHEKQTLPTILTYITEVKHMIFLTKLMDDMQSPDYGTSRRMLLPIALTSMQQITQEST
jgi:hypothetical protein